MRERRIIIICGALLLVLAVITAFFYVNRPVEFADAGLEEAVREALDRPEGPVRRRELRGIKVLEAGGLGIKNLEGIEHLVNLRVLNLVDNRVENVAPLARLKSLEELSLRNNGIIDISTLGLEALAGLPGLKTLSLRHNVVRFDDAPQVRLSDISILEAFTDLEHLILRDNHIEDIKPLSGLTNLETLDISQNPLEKGDISPLGGLTLLKSLNIRETGARDLSPLENLRALLYLNIHSNSGIKTLKPLNSLTNLQVLIMRNVPAGEEVDVLAGLVNLHRLNLRNCSVRNLEVLGRLMAAGALQDRPELGIEADVDIRDNPIPADGYDPIRPYWENITHREPFDLP